MTNFRDAHFYSMLDNSCRSSRHVPKILIPYSSTAEQRAVNSKVQGSNPCGVASRKDNMNKDTTNLGALIWLVCGIVTIALNEPLIMVAAVAGTFLLMISTFDTR